MIKRKLKICKTCGVECYLFSKGNCKFCASKDQKPIKKLSEKHKETLYEYKDKRLAFLQQNPTCQMGLDGCTKKSTCIHHKKGKAYKALYLDETLWLASCIPCNNLVENIGDEAYELGFKIRRNQI